MGRHLPWMFSLFAVTACSDATGPVQELSGARLYAQNCARCHGARGEGTAAQPGSNTLSDAQRMAAMSDSQLKATIRMGRPPRMPAFGRRFTDAALDVMAAHVRSLSKGSPAKAARP